LGSVREETSAGGLVVRRGPGGLEVALAEQWDRNRDARTVRLPKGHLEAGETSEQAARREVAEETGLHTRVLAPLPEVTYRYFERSLGCHIDKRVRFFLMAWEAGEAQPLDGEMERVRWVALNAAGPQLSFETERSVVAAACALLDSGDPPPL